MSRRKRQKWGVGSVFVVPLKDGEYCVGQVIVRERELLNSAAVAFYDRKGQLDAAGQLPQVSAESIISVIYVTVDLLNSGRWPVVGQADDSASLPMQPYEHLRDAGFVGAKIRGSSIAESFLNAFYALEAWDDWYVADYLDDFLISPAKKPVDRLVYSGRHPTGYRSALLGTPRSTAPVEALYQVSWTRRCFLDSRTLDEYWTLLFDCKPPFNGGRW